MAKKIFVVEPPAPQILEMILRDDMTFCKPTAAKKPPSFSCNPKRRQRQAAKAAAELDISTKAQLVLQTAREENAQKVHVRHSAEKKKREDLRFEQRQIKKKQKHKGR